MMETYFQRLIAEATAVGALDIFKDCVLAGDIVVMELTDLDKAIIESWGHERLH